MRRIQVRLGRQKWNRATFFLSWMFLLESKIMSVFVLEVAAAILRDPVPQHQLPDSGSDSPTAISLLLLGFFFFSPSSGLSSLLISHYGKFRIPSNGSVVLLSHSWGSSLEPIHPAFWWFYEHLIPCIKVFFLSNLVPVSCFWLWLIKCPRVIIAFSPNPLYTVGFKKMTKNTFSCKSSNITRKIKQNMKLPYSQSYSNFHSLSQKKKSFAMHLLLLFVYTYTDIYIHRYMLHA